MQTEVFYAKVPRVLVLEAVILANSEVSMSNVIKLAYGDTRPYPRFVVTDDDGVAVNITGSTPRFYVSANGKTAVILTKIATIVNGAAGECEIAWIDSDWGAGATQIPQPALGVIEEYVGELRVTFSDATKGTVFRLYKILVRRNVG